MYRAHRLYHPDTPVLRHLNADDDEIHGWGSFRGGPGSMQVISRFTQPLNEQALHEVIWFVNRNSGHGVGRIPGAVVEAISRGMPIISAVTAALARLHSRRRYD
jgi:hypothetical protein